MDNEHLRAMAGMLREVGYHASNYTLISGPPKNHERYERLFHPRVGDLVMEVTTFWRASDDMDAVGWLNRIVEEPIKYEDWDEAADGPLPMERVFYIQTLAGYEQRWTNATFVAIPLCGMEANPEGERYLKPRFANVFKKMDD